MPITNKIYNNYLVKKPWGEEYTIFSDRKKIAITLVKINPKKSTSLHSHPSKKTGFIILKGSPKIQIGIHKKNTWKSKVLSILVLRPGLFHSISNINKKSDVIALEFETPYKKRDLIRFKDRYGRQNKGYENKKFMKKLDSNNITFKNTNDKQRYNLFGKDITITKIKSRDQILKLSNKSVSAILDGVIVDKNKKSVISFGEIIKTKTLKMLTKQFYIHKPLKILNVL